MQLASRPMVMLLALMLGTCHRAGPIGSSQGSANPAGNVPPGDQTARPSVSAGAEKSLRLVVLIVIDQLPSWTFARDRKLLRGGIAELLQTGVYYPQAAFPYAVTYTAPGHASLGTGAPPAVTGILANQWYRPEKHALVSAVADPDAPVLRVLGQPGEVTGEGISGAQLRTEGVADVLRRALGGRAKSVSIAIKDRGAALALGRKPDLAVWYDADQRAMTTSRYYAERLPDWLIALAKNHPIEPRLGFVWTPHPDLDHAAITGIADNAPGEGAEFGMGTVFPHDLSRSTKPAKALRSTPLGDDLVLETALAALEGESLGQDDTADILSLSFSAHDYAGHSWGQESWERIDLLYRLDQKLTTLLDALDSQVGRDHYAVVLTSDHGATPLVEHSMSAGRPARRITVEEVVDAAQRGAARALGQGAWIADGSASTIYMQPAFFQLSQGEQQAALDAIVEELAGIRGIALAVRKDQVAGDCSRLEGMLASACLSLEPALSGQIFFAPARHHLVTTYPTGTTHGSFHEEDRMVPIIVSAPGLQPHVADSPVSVLQVAPTLSRLLGIAAPPAATMPPLIAW